MSDIKRYRLDPESYLAEHPQGDFVDYQDYARLKAEVEHLDTLCKQLSKQHSDISCENIMLRKAGDAMAKALNLNDDVFDNQDKREAQANWNAAKEGKPSV